MSDATRYPLCWPAGRPRTQVHQRSRARFHTQSKRQQAGVTTTWTVTDRKPVSIAWARNFLLEELARLGARSVILSSNLRLRKDDLPIADQRQPDDPGVAVYFTHDGREMAFACDRWDRVQDNILAAAKTIEALRGIHRWGTGEMVQAAFTGFAALPPARAVGKWWEVLGVPAHASTDEVNTAYRKLVMQHHPDRGGDTDEMARINDAYERFKKERGL